MNLPAEQAATGVALPSWWRQLLASERSQVKHVVAEFMATRELMPLLMKSRNGSRWTAAEKQELVAHLRRLTRLSPYLIFLVLPGSVVLLPAYAWWLDRRRLKRHR